jgi:hypothetical protein
MAVQDAVAAANRLIPLLRVGSGRVPETVLAVIQADREPAIRKVQAAQARTEQRARRARGTRSGPDPGSAAQGGHRDPRDRPDRREVQRLRSPAAQAGHRAVDPLRSRPNERLGPAGPYVSNTERGWNTRRTDFRAVGSGSEVAVWFRSGPGDVVVVTQLCLETFHEPGALLQPRGAFRIVRPIVIVVQFVVIPGVPLPPFLEVLEVVCQ